MNQIDLRKVDLNLLVVFEVLMTERSVSLAADRLHRTQSAVSHSLGRLRQQFGDPLLVKAGGRMQPSPYAENLIERVRPALRGIQNILRPGAPFEPASSRRLFHLAAPDMALALFPRLLERARAQAPGISIEWTAPRPSMLLEVAQGQADLAIAPAGLRRPEGVAFEDIGALEWGCFGRRGHPAFERWGRQAWSRWPHAVVGVGDRLHSPVGAAAAAAGIKRKIAAHLPNFGAVAPLLAHSDLLATLPAVVMVGALERYGLAVRKVPFAIDSLPHVMLWNARMTNDPEIVWFRDLLRPVIGEIFKSSRQLPIRT